MASMSVPVFQTSLNHAKSLSLYKVYATQNQIQVQEGCNLKHMEVWGPDSGTEWIVLVLLLQSIN